MRNITFDVNNGKTLEFTQNEHDGNVIVSDGERRDTITNGDFVMLYDLWVYVKDNDIQNDFINYNGKN